MKQRPSWTYFPPTAAACPPHPPKFTYHISIKKKPQTPAHPSSPPPSIIESKTHTLPGLAMINTLGPHISIRVIFPCGPATNQSSRGHLRAIPIAREDRDRGAHTAATVVPPSYRISRAVSLSLFLFLRGYMQARARAHGGRRHVRRGRDLLPTSATVNPHMRARGERSSLYRCVYAFFI